MPRKKTLSTVTNRGDNKERLQTLLYLLAKAIDGCTGHGMASLCREYRKTLKELIELTDGEDVIDPLGEFIAQGEARAQQVELSNLSEERG